jgi:miniconductance mechanosensitive channel
METQYNYLLHLLDANTGKERAIVLGVIIVGALVLAIIMHYISTYITNKHLLKFITKSETLWDDYMVERNLFKYLNALIPLLVFDMIISRVPFYENVLDKVVKVSMVLIFVLIVNAILAVLGDIYSTYSISRTRPIKSYLQIVSLLVTIIGVIIAISIILGKSPLIFLSGIGAMTAVIMLIFKDAILWFVASIQLAANNMVGIGDWIEMPNHLADGDVIEINLTNVKVQNFDKTITTIPSYALISHSFRNWKGMQSTGSRRIKRSIYLDSNSVRFLSPVEVEEYKKIDLLKEYIEMKEKEIEKFNESKGVTLPINGRRLTNIGIFRAYVELFLKNNPNINKNLTLLVRQQEPTFQGIPLEIYCFAKTIEWKEYESIQSDIFEHLIPVIHEFNLAIFQNPTGNDFQNLKSR